MSRITTIADLNSPEGIQIVANFYDCLSNIHTSFDHPFKEDIVQFIHLSDLTSLLHQVHFFENGGATGLFLLAESHLAFHTWPELKFVSLDLYVCNLSKDNTIAAFNLYEYLTSYWCPQKISFQLLHRGRLHAHV